MNKFGDEENIISKPVETAPASCSEKPTGATDNWRETTENVVNQPDEEKETTSSQEGIQKFQETKERCGRERTEQCTRRV